MLVLKRKLNESIMIGDDIEIKIVSIESDGVRIGIEAPRELAIYRKEIYLEIQQENQGAIAKDTMQAKQLMDVLKQYKGDERIGDK